MARNEKRTLNIRAQLNDDLTKQLVGVKKEIAKVADATKKANDKARKSWERVKKAAAAVLAVYGAIRAFKFARGFVDQVDQIGKLANALGRPVEEVSELSAAFVRAGGNAQQFRAVFASVLSSVNGAVNGAKKQAQAFETLGLTAEKLRRLNPTQILAELASGTEKVADENEKLRTLAVLFPEQYRNVLNLVGQGRAQFDATLERVRRVGATVTAEQARAAAKLNDAYADLESSLASVGRELLAAFGPQATASLNAVAEFIADNREQFADFALLIKDGVVGAIDLLADAIIGLIGLIESLPGVDLSGVDELQKQRRKLLDGLRDNQDFAFAFTEKDRAGTLRAYAELGNETYAALAKQLDRLDQQIAERQSSTLSERLAAAKEAFQRQTAEIVGAIRDSNREITEAAQELRVEWDPYDYLLESAGEKLPTEPSEAVKEAMRQQGIASAREWIAGFVDNLQEQAQPVGKALVSFGEKALEPLQETVEQFGEVFARAFSPPRSDVEQFIDGWSRGIARLKREVTNFYESVGSGLAQLTTGTLSAFTDELTNVITGASRAKDAWKDFLTSTLQLVARLIARLATLKLVQTVGSAVTFEKGGVLSGVGSKTTLPVRQYARGGVATRPQLALYGEGNRAEAFVPLPDNRSIPVTFTGNNGPSGTGAVVNVNVYAWDSKDAARGLLENQETIRAIFQSGVESKNGLRQTIQRAAR